ncbi:MAG TPA: Jag N-terminal domain-containing protein [Candidatus Eisenbacteria bacterium]|jgi:spoIIIJ-associated protein
MQPKGSIFEGKTLDDAVKKGLEALGLTRAEVMITVTEEGSGGFLGLGARPYKVRMMPRPPQKESGRSSRVGRRERPPERAGRGGEAARSGSRAERRDEVRRPGGPREPGARRGTGREAVAERAGADPERAGRRRRGRRGGRGRRGEGLPAHEPGAPVEPRVQAGAERPSPTPRGPHERGAPAEEGPPMPSDELSALGSRLAGELFQAMRFDARVSARADSPNVDVTAEVADDEELLTGRKGEVRQALQHLLNRMINRGGGSRYHVQLEINDFWQRREEELRDLALRLAEEAAATGSEKLTEYLNAQERRIVHVTLRDDARVKTYAIGDGLIKKVAVAPADAEESKPGG